MTRCRSLRALALVVAALTWLTPGPAHAADPVAREQRGSGPLGAAARALERHGRAAFDLGIQRPIELVELTVSLVAFVPAYPLGWLFGAGDEVVEICVRQPFDRVFRTPPGEL